jgi:hypothetical protein
MKRFRDAQESQSGAIRRDPARACGRRNDIGAGDEVRHSPAHGPASDQRSDSADPKETGTRTAETRPDQKSDRPDTASGSGSTAQTATHGASDLDEVESGTSRIERTLLFSGR